MGKIKKNIMKKIKLLVSLFTIVLLFFYSCSDSNSIESQTATKSNALRTILNEFKIQSNLMGKLTQNNVFCFDFVYPITLSYNNGTTISIASQAALIDVLTNENNNLYVDGIVFPFQVVDLTTNVSQTIANETQFWDLVVGCSYTTYDDVLATSPCFDFVYPFSVITIDNVTISVANENALLDLFNNSTSVVVVADFVYPFSVIYDNQTYVINNSYDFTTMNNNCSTGCDCPTTGASVCVDLGNQIVEFPNACIAECFGYTSAQFVSCGNSNGVSPLENILNTCLDLVYPVQVQYNGTTFNVTTDNELIQLYDPANQTMPQFSYPIQITFSNNPTAVYTVANEAALIDLIDINCI